jgi:cytochrome c biogenesis protein ResB
MIITIISIITIITIISIRGTVFPIDVNVDRNATLYTQNHHYVI